MLATGIGIPVMAALSATLGTKYGSPAFAASVLFLVALSISLAFLFAVLSVTWVAPRFGVGNAIAFVLLGQLISMAVIDQFGLMGAPTHAITFQRLTGLILMSVGVFLAVRRG